MMLKRSAIILVTCLLCSCGARPVIDNAKTSVRAEVYASPSAIPSESLAPTLPPSETSTATITPTSTSTPTVTPTPTPNAESVASEKPKDQKLTDDQIKSLISNKAELLKKNPGVSDLGIVNSSLYVEVEKQIEKTEVLGIDGENWRLRVILNDLSKDPKQINNRMFRLIDSDGTEYPPLPKAVGFADTGRLLKQEMILQGKDTILEMIFAIPKDLINHQFKLRVYDGKDHVDLSIG